MPKKDQPSHEAIAWVVLSEFAMDCFLTELERVALRIFKKFRRFGKWAFGILFFVAYLTYAGLFLVAGSRSTIFANVAQTTLVEGSNGRYKTMWPTTELFEDGAIGEEYVDLITDSVEDVGKPIEYLSHRDSRQKVQGKIRRRERYKGFYDFSINVCVKVVEGSTTDSLAGWRRGWGYTLARIQQSFPLITWPFIAIAVGIFSVVSVAVIISALVLVFGVFGLALSICRCFWILGVTAFPIRTYEWVNHHQPGSDELLLQVSDLHVSTNGVPYEVEVNNALWRHETSLSTLERLEHLFEMIEPKMATSPIFAMTGDLTDSGDEAEWEFISAQVATRCRKAASVLVIPGNHDVAFNKAEKPDYALVKRHNREERFQNALTCYERGPWKCARQSAREDKDSFPRSTQITTANGTTVTIIALDSTNYQSRHTLSNAVGRIGKLQLSKVQEILGAILGPVIIVTHHHVSVPKSNPTAFSMSKSAMDKFLITLDSRPLIRMLNAYARREGNTVLVAFGHQHLETYQQVGESAEERVFLYGHPSSTMGINADSLDGKLRYGVIGITKDLKWSVETVVVSDGV